MVSASAAISPLPCSEHPGFIANRAPAPSIPSTETRDLLKPCNGLVLAISLDTNGAMALLDCRLCTEYALEARGEQNRADALSFPFDLAR